MSGFKRGVAAQQEFFKKTAPEILTKQGRLLVRDLIKLTPGFDPRRGFAARTLNDDRRITEKAVRRDLRKVFAPIESSGLYNAGGRAGLRLKELVSGIKTNTRLVGRARKGKAGRVKGLADRKVAIAAVFKAAGAGDLGVIIDVNPQLHRSQRNRRGRVTNAKRYLVINSRSVKAYQKEVLSHVGRGKGGWNQAGAKLGTSIPGWIAQHHTPGDFIDNRNHPTQPSITVINSVPYRSDFETRRITQSALAIRAGSMKTEMRKVQQGMARAFNRKR